MLMKMRGQMQKGRNQKGFTLVELMVVVVIIGVLVAIAVPVYNNVTEKANRNAVEANLRTIDGAISAYQVSEGVTNATSVTEANATTMLQEWPTGPDKVEYGVANGRATVTEGTGTGDWFTLSATAVSSGVYSLPITWTE